MSSLQAAAFPSSRKAFKVAFQHLHTQGYFCIKQGVVEEVLSHLESDAAGKKGSEPLLSPSFDYSFLIFN
jgi:hypothetical protein